MAPAISTSASGTRANERRNLKRRLAVSRLETPFSSFSEAGAESGSSTTSGRGLSRLAMGSSLLRQILGVISSRYSQRPGELQFCHIVAIQAGDVLVIRARQRLLRLHDFDTVRYPGGETLLGARETFPGEVHVLTRNRYLLPRGLQIKECGADIIVNLSAQVFCFRLALPEYCFCFRNIAVDTSTSKDWYAHTRLKGERTRQTAKVRALHSVVPVGSQHRIALCASR